MKGVCLCKSVSIEASGVEEFEACHCGMCRKWGGGPFLSVHCSGEVSISGEESVQRFASSEWGERAFCSNCGTHLFYRLKATDEHFVPLGLFESSEGFTFTQQIFIDKKPDYYSFADTTQNLTEQQVFEKFGA